MPSAHAESVLPPSYTRASNSHPWATASAIGCTPSTTNVPVVRRFCRFVLRLSNTWNAAFRVVTRSVRPGMRMWSRRLRLGRGRGHEGHDRVAIGREVLDERVLHRFR